MEHPREKIFQEVDSLGSVEAIARALPELIEKHCQTYEGQAEFVGSYLAALGDMLCGELGMTGFQASYTMFNFILMFKYRHNKTSIKLVDYDNMLYPQYAYLFAPTLPKDVWERMQTAAKNLLRDHANEYVHPAVRDHWQSIADGIVPFGYIVKNINDKG